MRRLPIFLVIDVSESMAGKPIEEVQGGIKLLTDALMSDPFALETVYLSVIAFAGRAKTITPLTYILNFVPPKLPIGCGTNLSGALKLLMQEIDTKVKKNTPETKGDWKPLVFILTDGTPNDDYRAEAIRWRREYGKYSTVAVLMGENSDATALRAVTDNVLVFKETTKESYQAFFKWVSSSIQTSSKSVGEQGRETPGDFDRIRENIDKDLLATEMPSKNRIDYFVLSVRCQESRKPYIIRYVSKGNTGKYQSDGAYPVGESYFELSAASGEAKTVDAERLDGGLPSCPHCHNDMIGLCSCGKWLCLDSRHLFNVKCPYCGTVGDYGGGGISGLQGGLG